VPVQIGRKSDQTDVLDLELYERSKPQPPRAHHEFHMPAVVQHAQLFSNGARMKDMTDTIREVKKIQKSRMRSSKNKKWDALNYRLETASRKLKRVASLPSIGVFRSSYLYCYVD